MLCYINKNPMWPEVRLFHFLVRYAGPSLKAQHNIVSFVGITLQNPNQDFSASGSFAVNSHSRPWLSLRLLNEGWFTFRPHTIPYHQSKYVLEIDAVRQAMQQAITEGARKFYGMSDIHSNATRCDKTTTTLTAYWAPFKIAYRAFWTL